MSKNTSLFKYVVPIVFFGVLLPIHIHNRIAHDMSVWKGGVMGMFSHTDDVSKRVIKLSLYDNEKNELVPLRIETQNGELSRRVSEFIVIPSMSNLSALERHIDEHVSFGDFSRDEYDGYVFTDFQKKGIHEYLTAGDYQILVTMWKMNIGHTKDDVITSYLRPTNNWLISLNKYE